MSEQKIVIGNCLDVLKGMPSESVDVCVTSPPYWALRDYGSDPVIWGGSAECEHDWTEHKESARGGTSENANVGANKDGAANNRGHPTITQYCSKCGAWRGQLGLEPSPLEYVDHLMMIFDEVWRVLKPTGACWVNLGDTYATVSGSGLRDKLESRKSADGLERGNELKKSLKDPRFKQKSLCQIPSRFSIAMTDRGWILRNEILWHKLNTMPSSNTDRFTVDFEKFYFFVKEPKYYFKQQFEPMSQPTAKARFGSQKTGNPNGTYSGRMYDASELNGRNARTTWSFGDDGEIMNTSKWGSDEVESSYRQGMNQNRGKGIVEKRYGLPDQDTFVEFMRSRTDAESVIFGTDIPLTKAEHWFRKDENGFSYPSAEDWGKIRDKVSSDDELFQRIDEGLSTIVYESDDILKNSDGMTRNARTTWTICPKASPIEHCAMFPKELIKRPIDACCPPGGVVLDPFCGSGTTLEYCFEHDIDAIGIEINPDYEQIIKKRAKTGQKRIFEF